MFLTFQVLSFLLALYISQIEGLSWTRPIMNMFGKAAPVTSAAKAIITAVGLPAWDDLSSLAKSTQTGQYMEAQEALRQQGEGLAHQDAKIRLFGSKSEPRVTYYRDTAAWCPYCQKVWILLEEKKIPYKVEKVAMRSYGDKPPAYLKLVPNGLLPAINVDGDFMTDSLDIMMMLEATFKGPQHRPMWPAKGKLTTNNSSVTIWFLLYFSFMIYTNAL
jgi:glutaredoxin